PALQSTFRSRIPSWSGRANPGGSGEPNDGRTSSCLPHWRQRRPMRDDENLTTERATFVTHLECSATGARYAADELHNLSRERKPLLVRYDLAGIKKALTKEALARRPRDLWRYRELLPVRRARDIVSLGEPVTPIIDGHAALAAEVHQRIQVIHLEDILQPQWLPTVSM